MDLVLKKDEIRKEIFLLNIDPRIPLSNLPDVFKKIIPKIENLLSKYSSGEFRTMRKELAKNDFTIVLNDHKYDFKPSAEDLNVLYSHLNFLKDDKFFDMFAIYVFHSWFFLNDFLENNDGDFVSSLLSIMNFIINNSYFRPEKKQYYLLSTSCFIDIILNTINNKNVTFDLTFLFLEINDFFLQDTDSSKYVNDLVISVSEKLLDPRLRMNNQSYNWINSLTIIIGAKPGIISESVICKINDLILNYTVQLDQMCMKFFLAAIPYLRQETITKIIQLTLMQIVAKVYSTSESDKGTNSVDCLAENQKPFKLFETMPETVSNYFYPPEDLYQLNNLDNYILKIPIDSKLSEFIDDDLYQGLKAYEAVIVSSQKNATFFMRQAKDILASVDFANQLAKKDSASGSDQTISYHYFYRQYAIIINLIFHAERQLQTSFTLVYDNRLLFDPENTITHRNLHFPIVNFLRNRIFQIFMLCSPNSLKDILFQLSVYPELYRESVSRLFSLFYNTDTELERAISSNDLLKGHDIRSFSDAISGGSLMNVLEKPELINTKFCTFADALIVPLVMYRIMRNNDFNEEQTNILLATRKCILYFFNTFLADNNNFTNMLSSPVFTESFFILLFEPPIRQQFLNLLRKYLFSINPQKENQLIFQNLTQNILLLFHISCKELPPEETLSILTEFLNSINESFIFNNALTYIFEPLATDFCQNILNVEADASDAFEDLLIALISFLAGTSHDKNRAKDLSLIETRISHLIKTKPNSKIMEKLVQIIAGKPLSVCLPTFEIKQSKVLCTFIRIFNDTNHIYKAISFISKLCSFSSENCLKCHEGELDVHLINTINDWRYNVTKMIPYEKSVARDSNPKNVFEGGIDQFDDDKTEYEISETEIPEKKVYMFLFLLTQIASVVSSVSVVQRFFSMLCPIDGKYLSVIHVNILNALNTILRVSRYSPQATLPMLPSSSLTVENVSSNAFENGISFLFWISMPSYRKDFHQNVLIIDDDKKHIFKILINGNSIRVKIQSGTDFYHGDFEVNLPIKTWTMITVTLSQSPKKAESHVTLYINKDAKKTISKFAPFEPKSSFVNCLINVYKPEAKEETGISSMIQKDPPMLGLFMLSQQLPIEEIAALYDEGPRSTLSSRYHILFAYTPQECGQYISFQPLRKEGNIKENFNQITFHKKTISFYDLLLNYCKVSLILPIFGQMDIQSKDETRFTCLASLPVEILTNLFCLGEQPQISFFESNGFFIISHLLQNSENSNITFSLFMRYFNLYGMISYKNLQLQLIDASLMKIDLWVKADPKNQARILKQWARNLYSTAGSSIEQVRSVMWCLCATHYYYYYKYPSDNVDPSISECRKYLFEMIDSYIKSQSCELSNSAKKGDTQKFKEEFYEYFTIIMGFVHLNNNQVSNKIEEVVTTEIPEAKYEANSKYLLSSNLTEKKDFLRLLSSLLQNIQLIKEDKIFFLTNLLQFVIKCFDIENTDDEFILQCIELVLFICNDLHSANPSSQIVETIIQKLINQKIYSFKEDIFTKLCQIMTMNKVPELLPLICINILHVGKNYIQIFLDTVKLSMNYYINEYSPIYPILLLFKFFNTDAYHLLIRPIVTMFEGHWTHLINAIHAVGCPSLNPNDVETVKHDVLLAMSKTRYFNKDVAAELIQMIREFIFFRDFNSENSILNQNIDHSPTENESFVSQEEDASFTDQIIYNKTNDSILINNVEHDDFDEEDNAKDETSLRISLNRDFNSQALLIGSNDEISVSTDDYALNDANQCHVGSPLVTSPKKSPTRQRNNTISMPSTSNSYNPKTKVNKVRLNQAKSGPIESIHEDEFQRDDFSSDRSISKEYSPNQFCVPKIIEFIISNLVSEAQTMNFLVRNAFEFKFGFRFDNATGKWLDFDLAKECLLIYAIHKLDKSFSEFIIVLFYFLNRFDSSSLNPKYKEAFEMAKSKYTPSYINILFNVDGKEGLKKQVIELQNHQKFETFLISPPKQFGYNLLGNTASYNKASQESYTSILVKDASLTTMATTTDTKYQQFLHTLDKEIQTSKRIWSRLWRSLTIPRAPWEESVKQDHQEGFKRDNAYCFAFCPYKVRQISHIDKHAKAAMIRDTGDTKLAEELLRLKKMIDGPPKSLLFCSSHKEKATEKEINTNENANKPGDKFVRREKNACLPCQIVTIKGARPALFLLGDKDIKIFTDYKEIIIPSSNIYSVLYRTKNHRFAGLEIYTRTKESFLLLFEGNKFRVLIPTIRLMPSIDQSKIQTRDFEVFFQSLPITQNWVDGKISNFEYLMYLNMYSGRSFNDATKYPVFPWILSDYGTKTISFDDPKMYRDLEKPIGAIDKELLQELIEKSKEMKFMGEQSYLYSSGYSSPLTVYLWLIRLEPFTTQHIDIQEGKFDYAARIFKSIENSYSNALHIPNDYRELIPEFFFLPEFLRNMSGFDFGETGDGPNLQRVNDVVLPPWANNSPIKFIYLHRKALESKFVSQQLNNWIDLIWGYKQRGEEAVKAHNVYPEEMYPDIWSKYQQELQKKNIFLDIKTANFSKEVCKSQYDKRISSRIDEIESILMNIGQIPEQLFTTPHPKKSFTEFQSHIQFCSDYVSSPVQSSALVDIDADGFATQNSLSTIYSPSEFLTPDSSLTVSVFSHDSEKSNSTPAIEVNNDLVKHSTIVFQGIAKTVFDGKPKSDKLATGHVFLAQPNKLSFNILDINGTVWNYIVEYSSFKNQKIEAKPRFEFQIYFGGDDHVKPVNGAAFLSPSKDLSSSNSSKSSELEQARVRRIISPMFIGNNRLCFIDQDRSSVRIINCTNGFIDSTIKNNLDIISIQTDDEGWLAIAAKDATVTLYNVNHLPQAQMQSSALLSGVNLNSSFNTTFNPVPNVVTMNQNPNISTGITDSSSFAADQMNDNQRKSANPRQASISSFRESIKCIYINPIFDALICGTRDNWLLFCRLNINKMSVNRMINTKGRPQKLIVTDSFGFVVVFLTQIIEGSIIEFISLYDINGEEIRTKQLDLKRQIVAITKALSTPEAFDFLIVADDLNQIFVFEAFYLEFGKPIFKTKSRILKLVYFQEECLIIAFCADGTATVIYYPISVWDSRDLTDIEGDEIRAEELLDSFSNNQESISKT